MTELDVTPSRRPIKLFVAVLAAVVLVGAVAVTVTLLVRGGHEVRYEVETASGTALMITWTTGTGDMDTFRAEEPSGTVGTPWSTTVTFEEAGGLPSVAVDAPGGEATCRIFVDGDNKAESTGSGGALCEVALARAVE